MEHSKDRSIFACYALLLMYYRENREMEPCRTLVRCSSDRSRMQMGARRAVDVQTVVSVIRILIVIEEAYLYVDYASSSNKSKTCPIAFELSYSSLGS